jgi:uncharacterized protein YkwD
LKSRRNVFASLTLLVAMGCQQSDTVVRTEAPISSPVPPVVPFTIPAAVDHPTAAQFVAFAGLSQGDLSSHTSKAPTVWTAQSLSLEILPGSPLPVRTVTEPAPPLGEPVPVPAAASKPSVVRPAPAPATAPATTAPVTTAAAAVAAPPTTAAPPPVVPAAATVAAAPAAAADLVARTNGVRSARGLAPLLRDASLDGAAAGWARELATSGVLRHSGLPQQLLGKPWSILGENVGFGASSSVIHDALVNSAGHFANIVGASFTRIGVGAATDVNGRLWVVELFGG